VNQTPSRPWMRRWALPLALVAVVVVGFLARGIFKPKPKVAVPFETVERRDITMTVEATGTVEPVDLVEVKSKASGQILKMPVQVGSVVKRGDLLAQIDKVDVQNQYDQAAAALRAAQTKSTISKAQADRADQLFAGQVITAEEHEAATLDLANARSQLVKASTDLDIARQKLADATVRAPVSGTIIAAPVTVGQVISSATSSVSGGTTLLQMADLSRVRIRALVSETDIGSLHPGQSASVSVDAYPQRPFRGSVEKIEPQAVVQQSVTMFPVLVSISNEAGILLPGMNGEVTVVVDERTGVPAVPLDAVRTVRELPTVAKSLGLDADSLQAVLRTMRAQRGAGAGAAGAGGGGAGGAGGRDSLRVAADGQSGRTGRGGRGGRGGGGGGGWRNRAGGAGGGGAGGARAAAQTMIAMVKVEKGIELRIVRVGLSDFDYGEVLSGLKEGDQVAMLSVAQIQAQRAENISQIRERVSGMGGLGGGTGGRSGGGRSGGGASGGGRGGPGGGP